MDISEEDRMRFSGTMREVLNEMEPVCQEEQNFITNFFHLTGNFSPIFVFFLLFFVDLKEVQIRMRNIFDEDGRLYQEIISQKNNFLPLEPHQITCIDTQF